MNNTAKAMQIIKSKKELFCHSLDNDGRHLPLFSWQTLEFPPSSDPVLQDETKVDSVRSLELKMIQKLDNSVVTRVLGVC